MAQQPAREPAYGFIRRHDDYRIAWQEQREHHRVEAGMVVGDDQQAIRVPERRQVAENADTE